MSRTNSNLMSKEWALVIEAYDTNKGQILTAEKLKNVLESIATEYYFILHCRDIDDETKLLKRQHYHVVLKLSKRVRKGTLLNLLSALAEWTTVAISAELLFNKRSAVRYLVHEDSKDKYQYSEDDIITNNESQLFNYLHFDCDNLDTDNLIDIITRCNFNKLEIMKVIGIKAYTQYWRCIDIIIQQLHLF